MKKGVLNITGESVRKMIREALSPTFLFILLGAVLLWYTSKLSYEYTTDMPVWIRIDNTKYRLEATVRGRGSNIVAQRLSLKSRLTFTLDELSSRRSTETPGSLIITQASLQKAINGKINDLEIVQVLDAPEFTPPAAEPKPKTEPDAAKSRDKAAPEGESPKEKRQREREERKAARAAEKEARREAEKSEKPEKSEAK